VKSVDLEYYNIEIIIKQLTDGYNYGLK